MNELTGGTQITAPDPTVPDEETLKIALIADRTTAVGFRLAGVQLVKIMEEGFDAADLTSYLTEIASEPDIRIVLITEPIIESYGLDQFEMIRKSLDETLIIMVIPDSQGSRSKIGEGHLMKVIRRAIGQKRSN